MRAYALAGLLLLAASLITVGVALISPAVAWIVAGVLLAGWSVLLFAEVGG